MKLKIEHIILGMKIIPHSKSVGSHFDSSCWRMVKENKDPYLYVIRIDGNTIVLDETKDAELGDYFLPEDLEPYIERKLNQNVNNESKNVKMKKSELNSSMLFKMRDGDLCVLLSDLEGNMIFNSQEDIKQGHSSYAISLNDYDEDLSPENEAYDIVAIKQRNACVRVIADVLGDNEPEEWDWVEGVENKEPKVEETKTPIINNITINLTLDANNNDPAHFLKQLNDAIKKNGLVLY